MLSRGTLTRRAGRPARPLPNPHSVDQYVGNRYSCLCLLRQMDPFQELAEPSVLEIYKRSDKSIVENLTTLNSICVVR